MKKSQAPLLRVLPFLLGRRVPLELLKGGKDWSPLLLLLFLGLSLASHWLLVEPERRFSTWGFAPFFTEKFLIVAFCYAVSRSSRCVVPFGLLLSLVLEAYFCLSLVAYVALIFLYHYPVEGYYPYFLSFFCMWLMLVMLSLLRQVFEERIWRTVFSAADFLLLMVLPSFYLGYAHERFWYQDYASEEDSRPEQFEDYERIFFSQERLLNEQLDQIKPGVKGKIDLFYLGFGSYAREAVFKKEIQYMKNLFDNNPLLQAQGVMLINHRDTLDEVPLAIRHNLEMALKGIARKMNRDEDILFLYFTSHGSDEHELSIRFSPLRFKNLTPAILRQVLDESGIRWKVIVVSACYSGGYIEPLKDGYSLIATAADAENKSFGCSNENEFTYFGEALFHDQLANHVPILDAFPNAIESIGEREQREEKTPSNPQLWMEPSVVEHLRRFELQRKKL